MYRATIAMFAMTARAVPVSPTLLEFVALPVKKSATSFAEAAAARAVVEEVFPSPAAEPETQAVEDLFSSWETTQHRHLQQANDCDDPAGGCVADSPGYWCGYWLECSPEYLYTFQCRGWFCGGLLLEVRSEDAVQEPPLAVLQRRRPRFPGAGGRAVPALGARRSVC